MNAYERCNEVWKTIAQNRKVEWGTITPAPGKDPEYFEAQPLAEKETDDDESTVH